MDTLAGRKDDDTIYGGEGRDDLYGGSFLFREIFEGRRLVQDGNDTLFGGDGPDCVFGGTGDDVLHGGDGSDLIGLFCFEFIFDTGNDTMLGGAGADEIISFDGGRDLVVCGSGGDVVYANRLDRIAKDCERVFYPRCSGERESRVGRKIRGAFHPHPVMWDRGSAGWCCLRGVSPAGRPLLA